MKKFFIFFLFSLFFSIFSYPVSATNWQVCPADSTDTACSHKGAEGLQLAVNEAKDGDTINISGQLSGPVFNPFNGRMNVTSCFVDLKGKNLTLKGGALFGEGHDISRQTNKPGDENSPYFHRAGICSRGGKITIDGVRIKEFEGGGLQLIDSQVIIKNSIIDGSDHGGIFILGNSSLLLVNNYFISNIGIIPFGDPAIKAINNTFYRSKAIIASVSCNDNVPTNLDFINNIVFDGELTLAINGIGPLPPLCQGKAEQLKQRNIAYNILYKRNEQSNQAVPCYPEKELCEMVNHNQWVDPKLNAAPEDPSGWVPWGGDFSPQPDSPAATAGDPAISQVVGATGGPCADGNSSTCLNYVENNLPPSPTPTEALPTTFIPRAPGAVGQRTFGAGELSNITNLQSSLEYILKNLPLPSSAKKIEKEKGMDLIFYLIFSAVYIMFIHFAVGIKNFNIFLTIVYFILGGFIGFWFQSFGAGLVLSIILSLIFM